MYCLTIGLTPEVFGLSQKTVYNLTEQEFKVLEAIRQHEIIMSDGIAKLYKERVGSNAVDSFITANGNINGKFRYVHVKNNYSSGLEELLDLVSKFEMKILVGEKKDIRPYSDKKVNLVPTSRLGNGKYTELTKFIFPVSFHVKPGCKCEDIASWFKVLFKGEKKIIIQDKYLMNNAGVEALKRYYLPIMEKGITVDIYYCADKKDSFDDIKDIFSDSLFDDYKINIYECGKMKHDRYIELAGLRIEIGAGLDLLGKGEIVSECQECDINVIRIDDNQRLTIPNIIKKVL